MRVYGETIVFTASVKELTPQPLLLCQTPLPFLV